MKASARVTIALAAALIIALTAVPAARAERRYRLENVLKVGRLDRYKAVMTESQIRRAADGGTTSFTLRRTGRITRLPMAAGAEGEVLCGVMEQWAEPVVVKYEVNGKPLAAGSSVSVPPPVVQVVVEVQTRRGKPLEVAVLPRAHFVLGLIPRDVRVWPHAAKAVGDTWRRHVVWGRVRGKYEFRLAGLEPVDGVACVRTIALFTGTVSGANPEGFYVDAATVSTWTHPTRYTLHRRTSDIGGRYAADGGATQVTYSRQLDWTLDETTELDADAVTAARAVLETVRELVDDEAALARAMQKVLDGRPSSPWQPYAEFIVHPPAGSKAVPGPPSDPAASRPADPRVKVGGGPLVDLVTGVLDRWEVAGRAGRGADAVGYARAIAKLAEINRESLVAFVGSTDAQERIAAAVALAAAREAVPSGYAALAADPGSEVRRHVALGIGLREPGRSMAALLAGLMDDTSPSVRRTALWAAWRTTVRGSPEAEMLTPKVLASLADARYSVRVEAARCLGGFAPKAEARKALEARKAVETDAEAAAAIAAALKVLAK